MNKQYKVVNGTSYDVRTSDELIRVLESARLNRVRVVIDLDWVEEHDRVGYIGRSAGSVKIPLLVYNERSMGGGGLLDHCIARVRTASGKRLLWEKPGYVPPVFEIVTAVEGGYTHSVLVNGELWANCRSMKEAQNVVKKMS